MANFDDIMMTSALY